MYTIKEVAEKFNISANKLRFYEKKGLITPQRNTENGYRQYSDEDFLVIQLILTYRALDIPVDRIKKVLKQKDSWTFSDQLFKQVEIVNQLVHKYKKIQSGLEGVMNDYLGDLSEENLKDNFMKLGMSIADDDQLNSEWADLWDFENQAQSYDYLIKDKVNQPVFYEHYEALLNKVYEAASQGLGAGASILDIGVGTGNLAAKFLGQAYRIIGLDQSPNMLKEAKRKYPDLSLSYGDFLRLPFKNNEFDCLVSTYAFHHLNEEEKALALSEMLRVTKKDGTIVIGDIMVGPDGMPKELMDSYEYYTEIESFSEHIKSRGLKVTTFKVDPYLYVLNISWALRHK